jgi:hypothetical protein
LRLKLRTIGRCFTDMRCHASSKSTVRWGTILVGSIGEGDSSR